MCFVKICLSKLFNTSFRPLRCLTCIFMIPLFKMYHTSALACSYLGWDSIKVLPQHPPHVLACVRGHLVFEEEGELATLADAVEVAVDLVILTTCRIKKE